MPQLAMNLAEKEDQFSEFAGTIKFYKITVFPTTERINRP